MTQRTSISCPWILSGITPRESWGGRARLRPLLRTGVMGRVARVEELQGMAVLSLALVGALPYLLGQNSGQHLGPANSALAAIQETEIGVALIVIAIGRDLWWSPPLERHTPADWRDYAALSLLLVLIAAPTVSSCWLGLGLTGIWVRCRGRHPRMTGHLLIVVGAYLLKERLWSDLIASTVLDFEAAATAVVLGMFGATGVLEQNLIHLPDGRTLLLFRDCSLVNIAAPSTLALIALRHLLWPTGGGLILRSAMLLSFLFVLNTARLTGMVISPEHYRFLHDGLGAELFAAVVVLATAVLALMARPRQFEPPEGPS